MRSSLDTYDDGQEWTLDWTLENMLAYVEHPEPDEEISHCYLCHSQDNLESARFPDSSILVCVDCSVSWQHEHNLEDEWTLDNTER